MNRAELQHHLEELMERGLPHRAWDVARSFIEGHGDPSLRRVLKYGFLRGYLVHRLPASFWDERRKEEARRLGMEPARPPLRSGEVAFPVVFPGREMGCFVVAVVRSIEVSQDELPPEGEVDGEARRAMEDALAAARRLRGDPRRFRVSIDKPFPEPVKGSSCGLAVALAALSCMDGRELDDGISATGEVTRELAVRPVRDMAGKAALRREARPLARLLCPAGGDCEEEGLVPVSRLEDAIAAAWQPTPQALEEALEGFKRTCVEAPDNLRLSFRGLAKIARGSDDTTLDLLRFAVAPSLLDDRKDQAESEAELRLRLREPEITPEESADISRELRWMERRRWGAWGGDREFTRPLSFAEVIHLHTHFTAIGDPGAGKSLLTRLVFLACCAGEVGARARALLLGDAGFKPGAGEALDSLRALLPVRLGLGEFARTCATDGMLLSLEEFIRRQLREQGAPPMLLDGLGELLEAGRLFLLCDGLDEVADELREGAVDRLLAFSKAHERVRILVTSRPHGYYPKVEDFHHTRLAPLDYWQRRILVARLHLLVETRARPGPGGVARARRRTNELLHAIEQRPEWEQLISNPLLLTLSALTRTNKEGVPEHQVIVFDGLIETILGEWRSALRRPPAEVDRLLDAWSAVAAQLVQEQKRDGVGRAILLRMLSARLGAGPTPSPIDAKTALSLAFEAGLVREAGPKTVVFWHSTFAEFLAARFLVGDGVGASERLARARLTPTALQFAAAILDHVIEDHAECAALAGTLLDQDGEGAHRLLRPGLRTVSAWLMDGVRFKAAIRERLWKGWLEVLANNPPSPLWGDFGRFAERAPPESVPSELASRLADLDDHRIAEVREGLARVVAPAAAKEPAARAACEQWLREPPDSTLKLFGAFGLALASAHERWSDEVIDAVGRFGTTRRLSPLAVGDLVRNSASPTRERLRELVREHLPSDKGRNGQAESSTSEQQAESKRRERRLSAATLLAVAGYWDGEIARVLELALGGESGSFREDELLSVVRSCAHQASVRDSLLEWIHHGSALGERARKLVRDVAPLYEDMPRKVLECTARVEARGREKLESLLVEIGEELHTLPELLRRCLEDGQEDGERQLCAARILKQLAPGDGHLHEALRRGMRSRDDAARARWAHLALGVEKGATRLAMETLLACARSPDKAVRGQVYGEHPAHLMWRLGTERLEEWLDCAADEGVVAAARLDALKAVDAVDVLRTRVLPVLSSLLDTDDWEVRRAVASMLLRQRALDMRAAVVLAEEAVRVEDDDSHGIWVLTEAAPFAAAVVRTLLRELPNRAPSKVAKDSASHDWSWSSWAHVLEQLAEADLSCVEELLSALEHPGLVGTAAQSALSRLLKKHVSVRDALRARMREAVTGMSSVGQFRLIHLGLWGEEKFPEAIELARQMDPGPWKQELLDRVAHMLHGAGAEQDAARLWRLVLEGDELDLVVEAAESLARWYPEEVAAWLPPAVKRMFDSPEPTHRLCAARFALRYGFLEEEARAALFDCLGLAAQELTLLERGQWLWRFTRSIHRGPIPANGMALDELLLWPPRIDFAAMHAIRGHWPEVGLSRLADWLEDGDDERFSRAVKLLAKEDAYQERVRAALEKRLSSVPARQLEHVVHLLEEYDFYSGDMVERVLTRFSTGDPLEDDASWCLDYWLYKHPEIWATFRRQSLERRETLSRWLFLPQRVVPDAVAFAVELVLSHAGDWMTNRVEDVLQTWSQPPSEEGTAREQLGERLASWSPERVREGIRETLVEQDVPANLYAILAFDRLAVLGELRAEQRIENLRRALSLDITQSDGDELYLRAMAARRLLEVGARDERIRPVLEAAVHMLARRHDFATFQFASALRTLGAADETLKRSLVRVVLGAQWTNPLDLALELLEWAGLSVDERIELLIARLNSEYGRDEAPYLFTVLEKLGCSPERRAALLLEFVSTHAGQLPAAAKLELARRAELPALAEAKLLLSAMSWTRDLSVEKVLQRWLERFASTVTLDDEDRWWSYRNSDFLSLRHRTLARLSSVDDPTLVERALAELATARAGELFALYHRARAAQFLSDAEWCALLGLLNVEPQDESPTRLSKEWLTLWLWRSLEPAKVNAWLES